MSAHRSAHITRSRFGVVVATCFVLCTLLFFFPAVHDKPLLFYSTVSPALISRLQSTMSLKGTGLGSTYLCNKALCSQVRPKSQAQTQAVHREAEIEVAAGAGSTSATAAAEAGPTCCCCCSREGASGLKAAAAHQYVVFPCLAGKGCWY